MLYKKNKAPELCDQLFKAPTSEYRGTPFWAWNCELDEKELLRQIEIMKAMGFGGFHMHCRAGMATEYLSEEFMSLIKSCVKKAKREDMLAWLYDEDRWPSGFAGGYVTKDIENRGRFLVFSPEPPKEGEAHMELGIFDVLLDKNGCLSRYERIEKAESASGQVFYAYEKILEPASRYNGQTYVDTLNPKAIQKFIDVTYEAYKAAVGKEFDKTIPAIFTDEPQFSKKQRLNYATDRVTITLPWTDDLEDTYSQKYGQSLVEHIPELVWDLPNGQVSTVRYRYHAHVCERFTQAFADQCGEWCGKNKIALTGHMMEEPTLGSQTAMLGEAMPSYRGFQMPGIDMLEARFEYNTAKQCQSAVRQYGREAMMSELYGVTSWDFDFRGYKVSGDWQSAMGVTVRVPHLTWVSMEGEAKRDYPACIGYQSPWWDKFGYIEDHFARLNTALTRGKPVVRVGVIHPIESYWLHWGPREHNELLASQLEENFKNINEWLSFGGCDFDYICETTLPELCNKGGAPLKVGCMQYDAVVVPACETLRKTTVERLEAFRRAGGNLIFMGNAPKLMDAQPSDEPKSLYEKSRVISFSRAELLLALDDLREIELRKGDGTYTDDVIYQMRQDGEDRWVFICKAVFPYNKDIPHHYTLKVKLKGEWRVRYYDTLSGNISEHKAVVKDGYTYVSREMYGYDSYLFRLSPISGDIPEAAPARKVVGRVPVTTDNLVPFALSEPNALLLDMAEYALDDEPYRPREEILRIDSACRKRLGWQELLRGVQPWCIAPEPVTHKLKLRFRINSEIRVYGARLAIENPESAKILWNGAELNKKVKGYYVDKSIKTIRIPVINKGENILELILPFGKRTATEWCYILGNFGVRVMGSETLIIPIADRLGYSSIISQGLPFYGGALDYKLDFSVPENCDGDELVVAVPQYKGTLVMALVDGEERGAVIYPPYKLSLGRVTAGQHTLTLRLYVPRTNSFGPMHYADDTYRYTGPWAYRTVNADFGYEYYFRTEGITKKPELELVKY